MQKIVPFLLGFRRPSIAHEKPISPCKPICRKIFCSNLEKLTLKKNFLNLVNLLKFLNLASQRNFFQG
ncbi:hypothetical protein B5F76_00905 [Desulfovibrio sp. An276]|nr:hypothetical protein B5F76_00905 [Desulfovibrio sp. An276]